MLAQVIGSILERLGDLLPDQAITQLMNLLG